MANKRNRRSGAIAVSVANDFSLPRAQDRVRRLLSLSLQDDLLGLDRRLDRGYIERGYPVPRVLVGAPFGAPRARNVKRIQHPHAKPTLSHVMRRMSLHPMLGVCVRRKRRKEVMFAKGFAGRSVGRRKRWKRNYYSQFSC